MTTPKRSENGIDVALTPEEIAAEAAAVAAELEARALRALSDMRAVRDRLLTECDWTQLPDAALTAEQREAWAAYRQALRDLPQTFEDPVTVVWPVKPIGEAE